MDRHFARTATMLHPARRRRGPGTADDNRVRHVNQRIRVLEVLRSARPMKKSLEASVMCRVFGTLRRRWATS